MKAAWGTTHHKLNILLIVVAWRDNSGNHGHLRVFE
jgi:hypothetical protein